MGKNKYFHLWYDDYKKLKSLLKRQKKDEFTDIFAPEEIFIDPDWVEDIKNKNIKAIFGGYNINEYNELWPEFFEDNNVEFELWSNYFIYHCLEQMPERVLEENKLALDYKTDLDALFICMNHKPKTHRIHMLDMLAKYKLLKNNYYSWHFTQGASDHWNRKYWKIGVRILDYNTHTLRQEQYPKQFFSSFLSVVTETFPDKCFITEKTYYPILYRKPFIVFGAQGIHKHIESLGYKLPRDIVNYDFDDEPYWEKRAELIAIELKRLSNLPWKSYVRQLSEMVEHNRNLMLDTALAFDGVPEYVKDNPKYNQVLTLAHKKAQRLR